MKSISTECFISFDTLVGLNWKFGFHCLPNFALTDGNLAEGAGHLSNMVELPNPSQPDPGFRAAISHVTQCICLSLMK